MHYQSINSKYNTAIQSLSSTIQEALSAFSNLSFHQSTEQILSALQLTQKQTLSGIDLIVDTLSSVPFHPYQSLLSNYFEPDYKFKTIDDVPNQDDLPVKQCLQVLDKKCDIYKQTIFHNLTCCPEHQLNSCFAQVSCDNVVVDRDREKKYLEFYEMVKQIPLDSITENNAITIAKKIVAEYIKAI